MRGRRPLPRSAGYQPAREPKLRGPVVTEPPPLPEPSPLSRPGFDFGEAEEDGLRMLAALETMDSLEPDFCGDFVTEASVTIIERADVTLEEEEPETAPAGSLRARLGGIGEAPDIDPEEYAAYLSDVEEATVEIVEVVPPPVPVISPVVGPSELPAARPKRAHRFLKALIGGEGD